MSFPLKDSEIAKATSSRIVDVSSAWPIIFQACKTQKIELNNPRILVACVATIAIEDHFRPIEENGDAEYFRKTYGKRSDYEVDSAGLWKWRGRGFIQLTGKENYQKYSSPEVDLLTHPEKALEPKIAARIFAEYFKNAKCDIWADRGHWLKVRELVNGKREGKKPNGWNDFSEYIWKLLDLAYT